MVIGSERKTSKRPATIPELTATMLAQSRVIAKGRRIRDLKRLLETYGGTPSKWIKKSSPTIEVSGDFYEYHWYEHPGMGRVEEKKVKIVRS